MVEPSCVTRKMCGKIFILANDIISLICEFCGDDFQALEDFRSHLSEHFPSPTHIKNEDSISFSNIEYIPAEIQGDVKYNLTDDLQLADGSQSFAAVEVSTPSLLMNENNIKIEQEQTVGAMQVEYKADGDESDDENGMQTEMSTRRSDARGAIMSNNVSHRFQCDICQRWFTRKSNVRRHMMNVHTRKRKKECQIYSKSLWLRSILNVKARTGENPHKCNDCSKSFLLKSHLTSHRKKHAGGKHHICNVCNKSFSWKTHFIRHMMKHTSEKLHKCDVCNKSFKRKTTLTDHMATHTGEKPYKCGVCSRGFSRNTTLTKHMNTHTGERPHRCSICKNRFLRNYDLRRHLKIHYKQAKAV